MIIYHIGPKNTEKINNEKKYCTFLLMVLILLSAQIVFSAQERRPIDSKHPLWLVHGTYGTKQIHRRL